MVGPAPAPTSASTSSAAASSAATFDKICAGDSTGYSALPRRMTNEQLAHEVLLNPSFTLDEHGTAHDESPVHAKIRNSFHVAFWRSLEDDIRLVPNPTYVRVLRVLGEIHDGILDLASGGDDDCVPASMISSVIDVDLIGAQIKAGALEWAGCVSLIKGVFGVLVALPGKATHGTASSAYQVAVKLEPVSANEVAVKLEPGSPASAETASSAAAAAAAAELEVLTWPELQALMARAAEDTVQRPHAFCTALRFLLDHVKAVRIVVANARLRLVGWVLQDHGVEYERSHMDKRLAAEGGSSLALTGAWVRETILLQCCSGRASVDALATGALVGSCEAFTSVVVEGFVALVTSADDFKPKELAELMRLDAARLAKLHARFQRDVTIASVLVRTHKHLTAVREPHPGRVLAAVYEGMPATASDLPTIVLSVSASLGRCSAASAAGGVALCAALLVEMAPERAVPLIVRGRLRELLRRTVVSTVDLTRDKATREQLYADVVIPRAVHALLPRLCHEGRLLRKIVSVHLKVHGPRYNSLIPLEAIAVRPTVVEAARLAGLAEAARLAGLQEAAHRRETQVVGCVPE